MPVLERSKYVWQRRSEEQRKKVEMELWKYFLGRWSVSTGDRRSKNCGRV